MAPSDRTAIAAPQTRPGVSELLIGYARVSTEAQDRLACRPHAAGCAFAAQEIRGAARVAEFSATPALLDGAAALVWIVAGRPRVVYSFTTSGEKIAAIELIADPASLRELDLVIRG